MTQCMGEVDEACSPHFGPDEGAGVDGAFGVPCELREGKLRAMPWAAAGRRA